MPTVSRETSSSQQLERQLVQLVPRLEAEARSRVIAHFELMLQWNKTHNLTRIVDPDEAASLHYLDSLLPLFDLDRPEIVADIGSGNGLPGVIAAILWPSARVILLEPTAKRVSFLRALRSRTQLMELQVVQGRSLDVEPLQADLVLTRATFPWSEVPLNCARHLRAGGTLMAYLGAEAPDSVRWERACHDQGLVDASMISYSLAPADHSRHMAKARSPQRT